MDIARSTPQVLISYENINILKKIQKFIDLQIRYR